MAAFLVDSLASALIAGLLVRSLGLPGAAAGQLPGLWSLVPLAIDYVVGLSLVGQTLGMRLLSLRVIRTDQPVPVGLARASIRTVLLIVLIPALIFDKASRGLHDRVSDTVVVTV